MLETAKEAAARNEIGRMYEILKQLGLKGTRTRRDQAQFTAEEFKEHFEAVSKERFECPPEEIERTASRIATHKEESLLLTAGRSLNAEMSDEELLTAASGVKEKAPGQDNVRKIFIKEAGHEMGARVRWTLRKNDRQPCNPVGTGT